MAYTIERLNLDELGRRNYRVFAMAPAMQPVYYQSEVVRSVPDYWPGDHGRSMPVRMRRDDSMGGSWICPWLSCLRYLWPPLHWRWKG